MKTLEVELFAYLNDPATDKEKLLRAVRRYRKPKTSPEPVKVRTPTEEFGIALAGVSAAVKGLAAASDRDGLRRALLDIVALGEATRSVVVFEKRQ